MPTLDARSLAAEELMEIRERAVTAVQHGESPETVARSFCVTRAAVYGWLARYRSGGWSALSARRRGGRKPKIDGRIMRWVYESVTMKNPEQFQFKFALWTSKTIASLIWKNFGVKLSKSSVCRLLNQLGQIL